MVEILLKQPKRLCCPLLFQDFPVLELIVEIKKNKKKHLTITSLLQKKNNDEFYNFFKRKTFTLNSSLWKGLISSLFLAWRLVCSSRTPKKKFWTILRIPWEYLKKSWRRTPERISEKYLDILIFDGISGRSTVIFTGEIDWKTSEAKNARHSKTILYKILVEFPKEFLVELLMQSPKKISKRILRNLF